MPDPLVPAALLVVALGLLASLGWGVADFGGGLASRSAPVVGVLFASQAAGLVLGLPLLFVAGEAIVQPSDILFAALGGICSAAGLGLLYYSLSVGRMAVVMPVAAVLTAVLPVVFGFVTEGVPPMLAIVGILFAACSVVLVSRSPSAQDGRPSGFWYGVITGLVFGLFPILSSGISDDLLVAPVVTIRIASVLAIATLMAVRRPAWRVSRQMLPALVAIGLVDMLATAAYLSAIAVGPLAIAATLTSLSNVVTVALAALVLRERISPIQGVGIAAAGLAVVLIAAA